MVDVNTNFARIGQVFDGSNTDGAKPKQDSMIAEVYSRDQNLNCWNFHKTGDDAGKCLIAFADGNEIRKHGERVDGREVMKDKYPILEDGKFRDEWKRAVDDVYGDSLFSGLSWAYDKTLGNKSPEMKFKEATDQVDRKFDDTLERLVRDAKGYAGPTAERNAQAVLKEIDKTEGMDLPKRHRAYAVKVVRSALRDIEKDNK